MTPLVLCYGSNMSKARMRARCPGAVPVRRVVLRGWRLEFRGYADAVRTRDPADVLRCAVWRVTPADLAVLDGYEGVAAGCYERRLITLKLDGVNGIRAWVYVMPDRRRRWTSAPTEWYVRHLRRGYSDWGFARRHLTAVLRRHRDDYSLSDADYGSPDTSSSYQVYDLARSMVE